MEDIDKEAIAKKVYEATKDSDYYLKQQHKTEKAKKRGQMLNNKVLNHIKQDNLHRKAKAEAK